MRVFKGTWKYLSKLRMPNVGVVVFSLVFLYYALGLCVLKTHPDKGVATSASAVGILLCLGAILSWQLRWKGLTKNYRQIAVFFYVVFGILAIVHLRNLVELGRSMGVLQ